MALLLKGARCVDPAHELDHVTDIAIKNGKIKDIGQDLSIDKGEVRDMSGKVLVPGLMDMHVHLREPGQEYKEDIASGLRAAAKGGFCAVLAMPNTNPTCDTGSIVGFILNRARQSCATRIYVAGAISRGLTGLELAEIGDMYAAGAVAYTDDGRGVQDIGLARLAMDYIKQFKSPVLSHCQMEDLTAKGVVNEGVVSTRLGLAGWPAAAEEIQIARDIALGELTGCALHIQHITTARGVELVREAKAKGLPVSCEVTPHHLFLNEDDVDTSYDTNMKMNPPLRTKADNRALQQALVDGTIDVVATDHAPHAAHEKALEFELAPFGCTGLETALGAVLTYMVHEGTLSYGQLVERMAHAPRALLGIKPVGLKVGLSADVTIIDPELGWVVGSDGWESKSTNNAFNGRSFQGRATDVYVDGFASMQDGVVS
ncbi:MAG: dihydroorotase [Coriobacteriales bacterium]|jgi:dihydroorotase|nr:dihydroorotase [Coriobacteriales bacterium]